MIFSLNFILDYKTNQKKYETLKIAVFQYHTSYKIINKIFLRQTLTWKSSNTLYLLSVVNSHKIRTRKWKVYQWSPKKNQKIVHRRKKNRINKRINLIQDIDFTPGWNSFFTFLFTRASGYVKGPRPKYPPGIEYVCFSATHTGFPVKKMHKNIQFCLHLTELETIYNIN